MTAPGRRGRRRVFAVVTALLAAALAEGGARVVEAARPERKGLAEGFRNMELDDPTCYAKDPELGWRLLPDTVLPREHPALGGIRTNALSLRGPLPAPKLPGELRVVCYGDSVMFGLGLRDEDTVPAAVGRALLADPSLASRRVTVINAGAPGYSAAQGERFARRLRSLEPDVIVFWFGMNDSKRAQGPDDESLMAGGGGGLPLLGNLALFRVLRRASSSDRRRVSVERFRGAVEAFGREAPHGVFVRGGERILGAREKLEAVLARMSESGAQAVSAQPILLSAYLPETGAKDMISSTADRGAGLLRLGRQEGAVTSSADEIREAIRDLTEWKAAYDARMDCLPADAVAPFQPRDLTAEMFADNCHLTAAGAEAAGREIARGILRKLGPGK
ncbi:MAG: hypothetical protein HMLKMBBP_01751 [Planctomycetes bacterium]|nr:hypothetical protein [Planctomycetota bacterium]